MAKREKHQTPTKSGILAQIRIHGVRHAKHFPAGTPPLVIRQWLLQQELKYRRKRVRRTGKFDDDAAVYLEAVRAMPTYAQRAQHIEEWVAEFIGRWREDISPDEIRAVLARWRTEPRTVKVGKHHKRTVTLSAAALNKRRTALMHLYTVLDGKAAHNPVKDVPKFREPAPAPKGIPIEVVRQILDAMPPSKSRARLKVLAFTGIPPAQIRQLQPANVDLEAGTIAVPGRKKGAGTKGQVRPLTPDAIEAFKEFAREDAWGTFTDTPLRRAFRRACKRVLKREDFTSYDLRHAFGTELYRASGDIRATQVMMGHSTPALTHRYTLAAVDPRLAEAVKQFGAKGIIEGTKTRKSKRKSA